MDKQKPRLVLVEPPDRTHEDFPFFPEFQLHLFWTDWAAIGFFLACLIASVVMFFWVDSDPVRAAQFVSPPEVSRHIEFREELARHECRDCDVASGQEYTSLSGE